MQIQQKLSAKLSSQHQEIFPVIIYSTRTIYEIRDYITDHYGPIKYELPFINAVAVELSGEKIDHLSKNELIRMIADDPIVSKIEFHGHDAQFSESAYSQGQFGGDHQEQKAGYDDFDPPLQDSLQSTQRGAGVGIAVIDTGVSPHYDLIYPQNRIAAFYDLINGKSNPYDDDGHGTHVAGIACGNGFVSGKYTGTAPNSNLIAVKALDHEGNGTTSDILAALQWVINNRRLYNIRVINLSLGIPSDIPPEEDPLVKGVAAVVRYGLTVVTAAGNNGPAQKTINSPGISPAVITVGAADLSGSPCVASFSSRGPGPKNSQKPDLLAPGVNIISLDYKHSRGYVAQSGTSMAAPAVSGAAACLYSQYPRLNPAQVKLMLLSDTIPLSKEPAAAQGNGMLNYDVFLNL